MFPKEFKFNIHHLDVSKTKLMITIYFKKVINKLKDKNSEKPDLIKKGQIKGGHNII